MFNIYNLVCPLTASFDYIDDVSNSIQSHCTVIRLSSVDPPPYAGLCYGGTNCQISSPTRVCDV